MQHQAKRQRRSQVLRRHEARHSGQNSRTKMVAVAAIALIGIVVFAASAKREAAAWQDAELVGYLPGEAPGELPEQSLRSLAFGLATKSENALACMEQGMNPGCQ